MADRDIEALKENPGFIKLGAIWGATLDAMLSSIETTKDLNTRAIIASEIVGFRKAIDIEKILTLRRNR